jgi:hypothetical protein
MVNIIKHQAPNLQFSPSALPVSNFLLITLFWSHYNDSCCSRIACSPTKIWTEIYPNSSDYKYFKIKPSSCCLRFWLDVISYGTNIVPKKFLTFKLRVIIFQQCTILTSSCIGPLLAGFSTFLTGQCPTFWVFHWMWYSEHRRGEFTDRPYNEGLVSIYLSASWICKTPPPPSDKLWG